MAIAGIRGTGNWAADQRPKSWREGVLYLEPNGEVPLYALTSKMREKSIDDPEHNWWTKSLAQDTAAVTGIYETSGLSNAYDANDDYAAGSLVYAKMTATNIADFKAGHIVRFTSTSGPGTFTPINGRVMQRTNAGDNSFLTIKLLEADGGGTGDLSATGLQLTVIGTSYPEASQMPTSLSYNPAKRTNYTQIFIDSLRGSRTMKRTKLRTGDQYQESKRETLQYHNIGIEFALQFGTPSDGYDELTGMPHRTMGGIYHYLKTYNSGGIVDYTTDTNFSGLGWEVGGEEWLDYQIQELFRYGTSTEKLCFCGPGALTAINKIAKAAGTFQLSTDTVGYGIKVKRYETVHGDLLLKKHPLYNKHAWLNKAIFAIEPKNLTYCYIDDTMFIDDQSRQKLRGGAQFIDGFIEGFLTECTMEVAFPEQFRFLSGVGDDNTLS